MCWEIKLHERLSEIKAWTQGKGNPSFACIDYPKHETSAGKESRQQRSKLSVLDLEGRLSVKDLLTYF